LTILALRGLGKDYGARTAVGAIDLDVARGECFGLLGPNGAGKTTTILMACGVIAPSRGSVAIAGIPLASRPREARPSSAWCRRSSRSTTICRRCRTCATSARCTA
jgi:ABC-type multidrug transport system ATPase subunit